MKKRFSRAKVEGTFKWFMSSTTNPNQLALNPNGRLLIEPSEGETRSGTFSADEELHEAFKASSSRGLVALASRRDKSSSWPSEWVFWREFADSFLALLAHSPEVAEDRSSTGATPIPHEAFFDLSLRIPAMRGAEYASPDVFTKLWRELDELARSSAPEAGGLKAWLRQINPALHLLGKVTLHLAENKRSAETPFAFMAT